jgi:hypothetical protein
VLTYFSWDAERWLPRFGRILRPIADGEDIFREQTVMEQISGGSATVRPLPAPNDDGEEPVRETRPAAASVEGAEGRDARVVAAGAATRAPERLQDGPPEGDG